MTRQVGLLLLILLPAMAAGQGGPDTSDWECNTCPFPRGLHLDFDTGISYVTDDTYRFGDIRGFDDKGVLFAGGLELQYWSEDGGYWELFGQDLGLNSRTLSLEGGHQGVYTLGFTFEQLPRQFFGASRTPFTGFDELTLPSGWVTGGSTAAMTELADSVRPARIGHDRESFAFSLQALDPSDLFVYQIIYRHQERDGRGIHGGSFISQSTLLPEPIDYSTEQLDASISYIGKRGHARLAYFASMFDNKPLALTWDNPFNALGSGAGRGRAAMPPDNEAHQLSLSGAIRLGTSTRLSGLIAIGQLEQNESFLPYTINPSLAGATLPLTSAGAEVETSKFSLGLRTRLNKRLRVRADIDVDDRDNRTPRNDYAVIESDLFAAGLRRNVPYSFKRSRLRLRGDYRIDSKLTFSSGYRYRELQRDFQEVRDTDEHSSWFGATLRQNKQLSSVSVKFGHDEREGSGYLMPDDPLTGQNPLLRKYNMADRDRDFVKATISASPNERVDIGLGMESADEDYGSTTLGLLQSDTVRLNLDASVRLADNASLSFFYGHEQIDSSQAGSSTFATPDWTADIQDEVDTFSIGLLLPKVHDRMDVGLDYLYSDSTGRIATARSGLPVDSFPDLNSRLYSAQLYADVRPNDRYSIRLAYYYERVKTSDWMLDGLQPDTLPSILALGAESPDYTGGIFSLTFRFSMSPDSKAQSD